MNLNNQHLQPEQPGSRESQSPIVRRITTVGRSIELVDATPESRSMDAQIQQATLHEAQRRQAASVALSDGVAVESAGQPTPGNVIDLNGHRKQQSGDWRQQAIIDASQNIEDAYREAA